MTNEQPCANIMASVWTNHMNYLDDIVLPSVDDRMTQKLKRVSS
jgi:hypothetical protein